MPASLDVHGIVLPPGLPCCEPFLSDLLQLQPQMRRAAYRVGVELHQMLAAIVGQIDEQVRLVLPDAMAQHVGEMAV